MAFRNWSGSTKSLFWIGALFTLAMALSMTFLNVFIWKRQQSVNAVAIYNGLQFIMIPSTFFVCRKLPWKHHEIYLRLGVFLHALFYGVVLIFRSYSNPYFMGALLGIGAGFYWYAFNLLSVRVIQRKQRAEFNSYAGVSGSLANVIAPFVSGFIIAKTTDNIGYFLVFSIALGLFGISLFIAFKLHVERYSSPSAELFQRKHPNWNRVLIGNMFQGMKEGIFAFLPAILVYTSTKSELSLGKFSALTAFISSITFFFVGKFLTKRLYNEFMIVGSCISTAAIALFLINMKYPMILLYGVITAVSFPIFSVPFFTRVYHIIDEAHEKHQQEYLVEREISLNFGRVLSVVSFLIGYDAFPKEWVPVYLLLVGLMQVIAVFTFRKIRL